MALAFDLFLLPWRRKPRSREGAGAPEAVLGPDERLVVTTQLRHTIADVCFRLAACRSVFCLPAGAVPLLIYKHPATCRLIWANKLIYYSQSRRTGNGGEREDVKRGAAGISSISSVHAELQSCRLPVNACEQWGLNPSSQHPHFICWVGAYSRSMVLTI